MKITIDFLENKKVTVGGVEKEIKEVSYTDEAGNRVNATMWRFDKDNVEFPNWANIAPGSTIEANPWSKPGSDKITLYPAKLSPTGGNRSAGMMAMKEKTIVAAQERKERSIHVAQDRSAWMWAKNNASMLVANHPAYKFYDEAKLLGLIEEMATDIFNLEPTKPF